MRSIVNPVHPHIYIILTKRPDFALDFFAMHKPALTPNIWIGVSCETTEATWYRVPLLKALKFPGKKIISFEPLLSSIDATPSIADDIDWIICGAETGPKARHMDPIWAVRLAESASACNIPFFFKKFSKYGPKPTPEEIDLLYRREFPLPNSELPIYAHTSAGGRVNVQPKISYTLK
jgi:protein gp37